MALAKADLPIELAEWAMACPDPELFANALAYNLWLESDTTCTGCGDPYKQKDLREDASYFSSGNPICHKCWTMHDGGTIAFPDYKSPPWSEKRERSQHCGLYDGILRNKATGKAVGTVKRYNPNIHYAERVERWAYGPDAAEAGLIDLEHEIVTDLEPCETPDNGGFKPEHIRKMLIGK